MEIDPTIAWHVYQAGHDCDVADVLSTLSEADIELLRQRLTSSDSRIFLRHPTTHKPIDIGLADIDKVGVCRVPADVNPATSRIQVEDDGETVYEEIPDGYYQRATRAQVAQHIQQHHEVSNDVQQRATIINPQTDNIRPVFGNQQEPNGIGFVECSRWFPTRRRRLILFGLALLLLIAVVILAVVLISRPENNTTTHTVTDSTSTLTPTSGAKDRCIVLLGGHTTGDSIEYYHPEQASCDSDITGGIAETNMDRIQGSGCYLADTQQILIRESWNPNREPAVYGLHGSFRTLELPFEKDGERRYLYATTTAYVGPSRCLSCGGWLENPDNPGRGWPIGNCYQYDSDDGGKWVPIKELPNQHKLGWAASVYLPAVGYYVIGGWDGDSLNQNYRYDLAGRWYLEAEMKTKRNQHSAAVLSDTAFIVCGGTNSLTTCEVYNSVHRGWQYTNHLKTGRRSAAMVNFNGQVYAIGGYNDELGRLDTVERYDVKSGNWMPAKRLARARSGFIAIVV